jgi:hypothetical protein
MCLLVLLAAAITLVAGHFAWQTPVKGLMLRIATADIYLVALKSDGSLWAMGPNSWENRWRELANGVVATDRFQIQNPRQAPSATHQGTCPCQSG